MIISLYIIYHHLNRRNLYEKISIFSFLIIFIITSITAQQEKPTIAILDVVIPKGVEQSKADIIYEYIIDRINKAGRYIIVERADLDRALAELEISHSEIVDEATTVEIGKISGASLILVSSLLKEGTKFYLSIHAGGGGGNRRNQQNIR